MKPGGFKLNLGGIGSGGGWGIADAETPYAATLAHEKQKATDVYVEKKSAKPDFDGDLMGPGSDEEVESEELSVELSGEHLSALSPETNHGANRRGSAASSLMDISVLSQESSSSVTPPPQHTTTGNNNDAVSAVTTTTLAMPQKSAAIPVSTYNAYDQDDPDDDDQNTFCDKGSAVADISPSIPKVKPPTAPLPSSGHRGGSGGAAAFTRTSSSPAAPVKREASPPVKASNTFVQRSQQLPPLATHHADPYRNRGSGGGQVDSAHRGGGASGRSNASFSSRAGSSQRSMKETPVDLPGIREVKAKSGGVAANHRSVSAPAPVKKKMSLSGIIAGQSGVQKIGGVNSTATNNKNTSNKPLSRNAMQQEDDNDRCDGHHDGDWTPGHVVHQLKVPFDIKSLVMGDGNKDVWAAIGDDPITSFNMVGCDLSQNVQIASVSNVRSLAIVDAVEPTKNQGFGRPNKTNVLGRRSSSNSALPGAASGGSSAPVTMKGGARNASGSPSSKPLSHDSSGDQLSASGGPTKVSNLWCGLENGRIAIVNLFYNNEDGVIDHAHQGRVSMLFSSPSGAVWSSGPDKYLKIWDPSTRRCTFTKFVGKPVTEIIAVTSKREVWFSSMTNQITVFDYDGKDVALPGGNNNFRNTHKTLSDVRCLRYHAPSDSVWISLSQSVSVVSSRFKLKGRVNLTVQAVEFVDDNRAVCVAHGTAISKNQDHVVVYSFTTADHLENSPNGMMGPTTTLHPVLLFVGDPLEGISKVGLRYFPGEDLLIAPHLISTSARGDQRCISVLTHDYMQPVGSWGIPPEILKQVQEREAGGSSVAGAGGSGGVSTSSGVRTGTPGRRTPSSIRPKSRVATAGGGGHNNHQHNNNSRLNDSSSGHTNVTSLMDSTSGVGIMDHLQQHEVAVLDHETKDTISAMGRTMRELESDMKHMRLRQPAVVDFGRLTNLTMQLQFEFRRTLENYPLDPSEVSSLNHMYESEEGRDAAMHILRMKKALTALGAATNVAVASTADLTASAPVPPKAKHYQQEASRTHYGGGIDRGVISPRLESDVHYVAAAGNNNPGLAGAGWLTATGPGLGFDPVMLLKQQERQAQAREERYSDLVKGAHSQATATLERSTVLLNGLSKVQDVLQDAALRSAGDNRDLLAAIPVVPDQGQVTIHSTAEELRGWTNQLKTLAKHVTRDVHHLHTDQLAALATLSASHSGEGGPLTGGMDSSSNNLMLLGVPPSMSGSPNKMMMATTPSHNRVGSEPNSPSQSFALHPNTGLALTGGALPPKPIQFHDRITQCVSFLTIELDRMEQGVTDLGRNVIPWRIFLSGEPQKHHRNKQQQQHHHHGGTSSGQRSLEASSETISRGDESIELTYDDDRDHEEDLVDCGFMSFERRRLFQTLEFFVDICHAEMTLLMCEACAQDALDETKESNAVAASVGTHHHIGGGPLGIGGGAQSPLQHKNQERVKEISAKIVDLTSQLFATSSAARESLMGSSLFKETLAKVLTNGNTNGGSKGFLPGYLNWLNLFLYFLCETLEPAEEFVLHAKETRDHTGLIDALDKLAWWSQRLEQISGSLRTLRDAVSNTRKHAEISPSARYDRQRVDRTLLEAPSLPAYFFYLCALGNPEPLDKMMCDTEGLDDAGTYVDRISEASENLLMKVERLSKCCADISSEDYMGGTLKPFVKNFVQRLQTL